MLAAGRGTRFHSRQAKVLHPLCGRPMAAHLLDRLPGLGVEASLVVVGYQAEEVERRLAGEDRRFVLQREQLGTGHAVLTARRELEPLTGSLLVVYGDTPLVRTETLRRLLETREREQAAAVLLTCEPDDPTGYGRILRDESGHLADIVEEKDATPEQKRIREVNPGLYCFHLERLLPALDELNNHNQQGEYYLTDLPRILRRRGETVLALPTDDPGELRGINDRLQLAEAEGEMRRQLARHWMSEGVTMLEPESVLIDAGVRIGEDTTLYPGVILEGETSIGRECEIRAHSHLSGAVLGDGVLVDHSSVIRDSRVESGSTVGPFAHLRQQTEVGPNCRVGNFVEVKKSRLAEGVKAGHLTYLGDAQVGPGVNIGAGVITCNYDGRRKHETVIEEGAFIGSGSQLIAPVTVGKNAYVAAGSTITEDVPAESLAIARGRQAVKEGWVAKKKSESS